MNQIDAMKSARLLIEGTAYTLHTLPSGQACICSQCDFVRGKVAVLDELRQAIEQAERADKEAGFEMWWGEFMPSSFRDRAWDAWSMAHPTAPAQPEGTMRDKLQQQCLK